MRDPRTRSLPSNEHTDSSPQEADSSRADSATSLSRHARRDLGEQHRRRSPPLRLITLRVFDRQRWLIDNHRMPDRTSARDRAPARPRRRRALRILLWGGGVLLVLLGSCAALIVALLREPDRLRDRLERLGERGVRSEP